MQKAAAHQLDKVSARSVLYGRVSLPQFECQCVGVGIHGFQIWLKMPKKNMKDDPRYGTVQPDDIPTKELAGGEHPPVAPFLCNGLETRLTTTSGVSQV